MWTKEQVQSSIPKFIETLGDGQLWEFRASQRAWECLELETGCPFTWFLANPGERYGHTLRLIWCLTSTWRRNNAITIEFEDFLDLLPSGILMQELEVRVGELVRKAFPRWYEDEEDEDGEPPGEPAPDPSSSPEPTGSGEDSKPELSGV